MDYEKLALDYHEKLPRGKIEIKCTKPLNSQDDLAMAYSPGVAGPCRQIHEDPDYSFRYTSRGNLVGVISNGTAVLGLGNIGPWAAKPVMEGKGMLFKKFANIDVFDIELALEDPDEFIRTVKALEPTFGGINLEDIKAPQCFYIEEKLKKSMSIPVFHDDQHGTAIIAAAAFINALELTNRRISETKVVFNGAGAAAISCASLFITLGVQPDNLIMCDSGGVIRSDREDLNPYKRKFARKSELHSLKEAICNADVFIGVSVANILTPAMLKTMAKDPIVFALANPDPEINPELAMQTRADVILATGRSDYPNQVNNVLGFPYIFRGALDVRATEINEEMKLAAVYAIASLAKEEVPEDVLSVYKSPGYCVFGRNYLIPKPVDQRVLLRVAPAVAEAAIASNVARIKLDIEKYKEDIERLLGPTRRLIRKIRTNTNRLIAENSRKPKIVVTAGNDLRVIKAARQIADNNEIRLCILGNPSIIQSKAQQVGIGSLDGIEVIDPETSGLRHEYAQTLYEIRNRKGVSRTIANHMITEDHFFAAIMLHRGEADGMVGGIKNYYRNSVLPILQIIKTQPGKCPAGVYIMSKEQKLTFFADCTISTNPTAEELAEIAIATAETAAAYTSDPIRVAMLSYASFGSVRLANVSKVARAVEIIGERAPGLEVDGEMQVDVALDPELREQEFPFSRLKGRANVLIFPDLGSANISYKLLTKLGGATPSGPILVGIRKAAHVLQRSATVQEIANMICICAYDALKKAKPSISL